MKILFTGDYLPEYNRTQIIKVGLRKLGHEVIEYSFKKKSSVHRVQLRELADQCDFVFMPSFTHREVGFVRQVLGPKKIIIFDPLISRYLTKVFDYKLVWRWSLSALRNYYRDKLSMGYADFVVTDTQAHLEYFYKTFNIPREKMRVLYIGNNFDEYHPAKENFLNQNLSTATDFAFDGSATCFLVGFYGGFIPLQGVMNILRVAEILRPHTDIKFELIGSGFEFEKAKKYVHEKKLLNVSLPGWAAESDLCERIQKFDVAMGVFGETEKSNLVIPNKLYHYAACAKPIVTKDSPAVREIFVDKEDLLLVNCDPQTIAEKILLLKADALLRSRLGKNAHQKLLQNFSETHVAAKLVEIFEFAHTSTKKRGSG